MRLSWFTRRLRITNILGATQMFEPRYRGRRAFFPAIEVMEDRCLPATFLVTTTADTGAGSLRAAITAANAMPGDDQIHFAIGSGLQIIRPTLSLPPITGGVIIDGTTQPGYQGAPLIELDGGGAGAISVGLSLGASGCTVRGLIINGFGFAGILISNTAPYSRIIGNYLGTTADGGTARGNLSGIELSSGSQNITIGGTASVDRNVISGNGVGVRISSRAQNNLVLGNFIGLNASGTEALANRTGVLIVRASENIIGGAMAGARNVISGNENGIAIDGLGGSATNNQVLGNYVGTNPAGTAAIPNMVRGVWLSNGASENTIGGALPGSGNLISGNRIGIHIQSPDQITGDNQVLGNLIGTNAAGMASLANTRAGVSIYGSGNTVGGITPGERNLISGNAIGLEILLAGTADNQVLGNYIGTNLAGTAALSNTDIGVAIYGGASRNVVGGTKPGARNVISGNRTGVLLAGTGTSENRVLGNYVGTNALGQAALPNRDGVSITDGASNNLIGGRKPEDRNIISGNDTGGVLLSGSTVMNNQVLGNYIGTDMTGMVGLGNQVLAGVRISFATRNLIGDVGAGNVISGNDGSGVLLYSSSNENQILGNSIGTDVSGMLAVGNGSSGVYLTTGSANNMVGGTIPGARNLIAGNGRAGVRLFDSGPGNRVLGNYIGTDIYGTKALGNATSGVVFEGTSSDNEIGGTEPGAGNLISGNTEHGISVLGGAAATRIRGNRIGTNASGMAALANGRAGVHLVSPRNVVGGLVPATRNLISGNGGSGVEINGDAATANRVEGNYVGTNATGVGPLGNGAHGVVITLGASGNVVGGTSDGNRNVIAGNGGAGVHISSNASENQVVGNYLGVDASGSLSLGNREGVALEGEARANRVGGTAGGAGNVISGNTVGILIAGPGVSGNLVQGNRIGTTAGGDRALGNGTGVYVNDAQENIIGGTTGSARNLISGNTGHGIVIQGPKATRTVVQGNYVGTTPSGWNPLPNGQDGIHVMAAPGNTIGGDDDGAGNIISGNGRHGVHIAGVGATGNLVHGNFIGVSEEGALFVRRCVGNMASGISIESAPANTIGGVNAGMRNTVGCNRDGITIGGVEATTNRVLGNSIGLLVGCGMGTCDLGNDDNGVLIRDGASYNVVGGIMRGEGNIVSRNHGPAVRIDTTSGGDAAVGNSIRGNRIYANVGLGIDLGGDGVTPNDFGDYDEGPNTLQNFPELWWAEPGKKTRVLGTLVSSPDTTFELDFYAVSEVHKSGYGPGERYLGSVTVTTDANGEAYFDVALTAWTVDGEYVTATATDPGGNTSEFSGSVPVVLPMAPAQQAASAPWLGLAETLVAGPDHHNEFAGVVTAVLGEERTGRHWQGTGIVLLDRVYSEARFGWSDRGRTGDNPFAGEAARLAELFQVDLSL